MKGLFTSRKFWSLTIAMLILVVGVFYPAFQLDEEQTIGLVIVIASYMLGVAVDPGPGGWRGVLASRKFWAAAVGLVIIFTNAFGLKLPTEITPDFMIYVCLTFGTYIGGVALESKFKPAY